MQVNPPDVSSFIKGKKVVGGSAFYIARFYGEQEFSRVEFLLSNFYKDEALA